MVAGLLKFKDYFKDYTNSNVLIGGAASDILFTENETEFRATRDLDMVLIVEALTPHLHVNPAKQDSFLYKNIMIKQVLSIPK